MRDRLESVKRQTGITPPELLDLTELPSQMKYIWKYFTDLDSKRRNNGFGPLPINYSDILAYFSLYRIQYEPIEIQLIELLDGVALKHYSSEINKNKK